MNINNRISEVLHLILGKRERDGGYYGYTSEIFKPDTKIQSIFVSSIVCRLLLESAELIKYTDYNLYKEIRKSTGKTIVLIEKNRRSEGTWNYYTNRSDAQKNVLPDDLDDTFNSLLALDLFDEDKTDSNTLLATMKVLLATERKLEKASAYNTWVADIEDIDPVVQIITYKFLSRIRSVPSDFDTFLNQTLSRLKDHLPSSKYYESKFYILMELSSVSVATRYTHAFKKYLEHVPNDTLDCISHYQIKSNLGLLKKDELQKIIKINYKNKRITPFYIESNIKGHKEYCYSDVVVLALYLRLLCSPHIFNDNATQTRGLLYNNIIKSCKKELSIFDSNITELDKNLFEGRPPLNHIINELLSWCKYINFNLDDRHNINYINEVTKYTYFGWIAYTISDSVIDNQISKRYLAIGNHFLFKSSLTINNIIYSTCDGDQQLIHRTQSYVEKIYQRLHKANHIESRPPVKDIKNIIYALENKALGHSIGFLMLYIKQKSYNLFDMNHILQYFQASLSMKQLSDDIHDWKSDIKQRTDTLPTFLLRGVKSAKHETYINKNVMPKILEVMRAKKVSLEKALIKLDETIRKEDQIKLIDASHKYLKGVKQAVQEIKFYEMLKS